MCSRDGFFGRRDGLNRRLEVVKDARDGDCLLGMDE